MFTFGIPTLHVRHGYTGENHSGGRETRLALDEEYSLSWIHDGDVSYLQWEFTLKQPTEIPVMGDTDRLVSDKAISFALTGDDFEHDGNILVLYQYKEWWMRPTWCKDWDEIPALSQAIIWHDYSGIWHTLIANTHNGIRVDFSGSSSEKSSQSKIWCVLSANREHVCEELALCAYSTGSDVYSCMNLCVRVLAEKDDISTRDTKSMPNALKGFGWCTWDSLEKSVSEVAIFEKMDEFKQLGVPIDWVLIDDGWSDVDRDTEQLLSFHEDRERFPEGLKHTVATLKKRYGVRSVGVWQCFHGYWGGIANEADEGLLVNSEMTASGIRVPSAQYDNNFAFWNQWHSYLSEQGIDFVKVDSQGSMALLEHGVKDFTESTRQRYQALEQSAKIHFEGGLINCMGMTPQDLWNRPSSAIIRSSNDYIPRKLDWLTEHLHENAYISLLTNELYFNDWDMFWTEHPHAKSHAIARLLSGGPTYCSDGLGNTNTRIARLFSDNAVQEWHIEKPARLAQACILNPDNALILEAKVSHADKGNCEIFAVFGTAVAEDGKSSDQQKFTIEASVDSPPSLYEENESGVVEVQSPFTSAIDGGEVRLFYSRCE